MRKYKTIKSVEYTPQYKGNMNRFKITLQENKDIATVYLFSSRNKKRTTHLKGLLKIGNLLTAELTIIQDPEYGGERNVAMVTKIIDSKNPSISYHQPSLLTAQGA